jgi:hypothetical protein
MSKTTNLNRARNHCANWNSGKCLGVCIKVEREQGKKPLLRQWLDTDIAYKSCRVNEGCGYFNHIVAPAISL